ncbi:ATP-binding protein [Kitasatospora sp. RB6PN24]|uniref:ATP-binding protein n=1 Tax=Kitasatospora humi TaxID=2893891 RepID=UPI001E5A99CE|nr:ATP-binding protein [Kitasatospora humi]MCC9309125.1 ATP-binding protein [Kitasatospora humi]
MIDTTQTSDVIPVMLSGQALTSLRESGYTLSTAIGEVVDNSIEANANRIQILMEETTKGRKKTIDRVIVIDDGVGMDDNILQHYLQLGYSTRFMSDKTIGKFGIGAKLAGLSVGERIDVWSRVAGDDRIRHVEFDLQDARSAENRGEQVGIYPPDDKPLPAHLEPCFPEGTGTLLMWSKIDRASNGRGQSTPDALRLELQKELSRMFREFLYGGIKIEVDTVRLFPHDPTFLRAGSWADHVLTREVARVQGLVRDADLPDDHFAGHVFFNEWVAVDGTDHKVRVVITLAPREVVRRSGVGGDSLAKNLRIPDNEGMISFMRLNREISYTIVPKLFPGGIKTPDRYIGFEVHFDPTLDRMMGVRNVKRGAEPSDELRRTLRTVAERWIPNARAELQSIWGEMAREEAKESGEHAPINKALTDADRSLPKGRVKETVSEEQQLDLLSELARDAGKRSEEERAAYVDKVKEMPFVIETVDFPGTNMFEITHVNGQSLIRLNSRHRFYKEMYAPLRALSQQDPTTVTTQQAADTARRAAEAITLLLVAYARAEAQHPDPAEHYGDLRQWWGNLTDRLLFKVKDVLD